MPTIIALVQRSAFLPRTCDIPNFSPVGRHDYWHYSSRTSVYLGAILYSGYKLATTVSFRVIIVIVQRSNVCTDTASLNMSTVSTRLFPIQGYLLNHIYSWMLYTLIQGGPCNTVLSLYLIELAENGLDCAAYMNQSSWHPFWDTCLILIIIIIFINCNWVLTRWQWLFYMYTNMEKKVTRKFKSGGLHERHVVATWKLGNHLSIRL